MIKNNNKEVKPASKENKKKFLNYVRNAVVGLIIGSGLFSLGYMAQDQIKYRAIFNDLSTEKQMKKAAEAMKVDKNLAGLNMPRVVFPRNGVLTLNVRIPEFKLTDEVKNLLQKNVDEINRAFDYVNPKYSVKLEYDRNKFKDMYSIDIYESNIPNKSTLGQQQYKNYNVTYFAGAAVYNSRVTLDIDKIKKYHPGDKDFSETFSDVFLHEVLGHAICGMADAYNKDEYRFTQTIMDFGGSTRLGAVLPSDMAIMLVKYSKDSDYDSWNEKANQYFNTTEWYMDKLQEARYLKGNAYSALISKYPYTLKDAKENEFQYENLGDVYYELSGAFLRNVFESDPKTLLNYDYVYSTSPNFKKGERNYGNYYFFDNLITNYNTESANYEIDGVRYVMNEDEYIIKYGDKVFGVEVDKDEEGKLSIKDIYMYNSISKEEFDNGVKSAAFMKNQYEKNVITFTYEMYTKALDKYCEENDITIKDLPEIKGLYMETYSMDKFQFDAENSLLNKEEHSIYGNENINLKYKILDDKYVLCSNGDVIVNTKYGMRVLNVAFDKNKLDMFVESNSLVDQKTMSYPNATSVSSQSHKGAKKVAEYIANKRETEKPTMLGEIFDHARKMAQNAKETKNLVAKTDNIKVK